VYQLAVISLSYVGPKHVVSERKKNKTLKVLHEGRRQLLNYSILKTFSLKFNHTRILLNVQHKNENELEIVTMGSQC
jgi:hypothetical protein